jgi:two-component system nitrogen regulation response regulator GlnG
MSPKQIWLVDDDPLLAEVCEDSLVPDFAVHKFNSGEDVLKAFGQGRKPQVIVTDLKMTGMDGLDLAQRLKQLHSTTPVILMSGASDSDTMNRALEARVFRFLPKPFRGEDLKRAVERTLSEDQELLALYIEQNRLLKSLAASSLNRARSMEARFAELERLLTYRPLQGHEVLGVQNEKAMALRSDDLEAQINAILNSKS